MLSESLASDISPHVKRPMFRSLLEKYMRVPKGTFSDGFMTSWNSFNVQYTIYDAKQRDIGDMSEATLLELWEEYKKTLTSVEQELL